MRIVDSLKAMQQIKSGDRVFIHGGQMIPAAIVKPLAQYGDDLKDIEVVHLHVEGELPYLQKTQFHINNLFVASNTRETMTDGTGSYIPVGLSMIPKLFEDGTMPLDVALVSVSPPDMFGVVTLGASVDVAFAAVKHAKVVIAQANENVPRTHGTKIHMNKFDFMVFEDTPIKPHALSVPDDKQTVIGEFVADEIENNSVIQLGIGAISSMIATKLTAHSGLSVHTEMITDTVVPLVESGVINGKSNRFMRGVPVMTSFSICGSKLFDVIENDRRYQFYPIDVMNNFTNIVKHDNFCAINNIIEVDITGNTCCDTVGHKQYSGIGGQHDYAHAATYSKNGKSFLCTKSRTSSGTPRVVSELGHGAGSTVPRHVVDFVVTEYGIVRLRGLNIHQRIKKLISIAHPKDREKLAWHANRLYDVQHNVFFTSRG